MFGWGKRGKLKREARLCAKWYRGCGHDLDQQTFTQFTQMWAVASKFVYPSLYGWPTDEERRWLIRKAKELGYEPIYDIGI